MAKIVELPDKRTAFCPRLGCESWIEYTTEDEYDDKLEMRNSIDHVYFIICPKCHGYVKVRTWREPKDDKC